MPDFWFFTTTTALFDSLSTALQIVIFVLLLSTKKPLANSLGFLAGLSLTYLACGLVFLWQMGPINAFIHGLFPQLSSVNDGDYYFYQGLFGVAGVVFGLFFLFRKGNRTSRGISARLAVMVKVINPVTAVIFGALLSLTSFPFALPYLGALEKIAGALGTAGAIPGVLYYNLVYIVPLLVPLAIYLLFRNRVADIEAKLHLHSHRWGNLVNYTLVILLGLLFIADSAAFYLGGHGLLASKFF